jgi:hypothetical protein
MPHMQLTRVGRFVRRSIKRFIYSQLYLRDSLMILFRKSAPLVLFNVEDDPPSIYINFRIRPERVEPLADLLDLPDGLTLTPIRFLDGEEPFHAITLNAYRVSGLVNGVRAEWSAYVRDGEGVPRYLVIEAQSDVGSMDPVHIVTRPGSMEHVLEGDRLHARISCESQGEFAFEARLPALADREALRSAPEWIEANDLIYWRNGICDRTFYDAALASAPLWRVPLSKRVQFAMSPWWNV